MKNLNISTIDTTSKNTFERIISFDVIRIIAFLTVVIHHCDAVFMKYGLNHSHLGWLGVSFFIILSGSSLCLRSFNTNYLSFLKNRFASILPSYWVTYCIILLCYYIFSSKIIMHGDLFKIILTIFAIDGYFALTTKTYYLIGEWFTGFIILMYFMGPLIHRCIKSFPYISLSLFLIISYFSFDYSILLNNFSFIFHKIPQFNISSRIFEFAFGIFFSLYIYNNKIKYISLTILSIFWLLLSLLILSNDFFQSNIIGITHYICTFILTFFILTFISKYVKNNETICEFLVFFSQNSFVAFLFHHQIINLLSKIINITYTTEFYTYFFLTTVILSYFCAYIIKNTITYVRKIVFS